MAVQRRHANDRRVRRTQTALHDALMSLIHDKRYDSIAVREILDRANVGRSTFYAHFHDKDDLLVSGIRERLASIQRTTRGASLKPCERLVAFSLPVLEYIDAQRKKSGTTMTIEGRAIVHAHLRREITDVVAAEMQRLAVKKAPWQLPPELVVQYLASTFSVVLSWWLASRCALAPKEVDAVFRALVVPALA